MSEVAELIRKAQATADLAEAESGKLALAAVKLERSAKELRTAVSAAARADKDSHDE